MAPSLGLRSCGRIRDNPEGTPRIGHPDDHDGHVVAGIVGLEPEHVAGDFLGQRGCRSGVGGDDRLAAAVAANAGSAAALAEGVVHEVLDFQSNDPKDDVAVVAVRVPGAPRGSLGVVPDSR